MRQVALVVAALASSSAASADRQLWLEGGIGGRVTKQLELELTPELRFDQDVSRMDKFLADVGARYRVRRWLRFGGGYRLEYERDGMGDLVLRHRLAADVRVRYEREPLRVDVRSMVFEQIRPASGDSLRTGIRNRLVVGFRRWHPWVPEAAVEVFHALGDLDEFTYDKVRFSIGGLHDRGDHDFELLLRVELHADPAEPTYYILGLGYHYDVGR
jgi:hypothetical protein